MKRREGIIFDIAKDEMTKQLPIQLQMWNILENPESSYAGWIFGIISLVITWLSIVTASLETIPEFHGSPSIHINNDGRPTCSYWCVVEIIINGWFLIEFLLRLVFSQNKVNFFKETINWVDILAIIPYFVLLTLQTKEIGFLGIIQDFTFYPSCQVISFFETFEKIKSCRYYIKIKSR